MRLLALVILILLAAAPWLPGIVDRLVNRTGAPAVPARATAQALHDSLWIADFHNDVLLWPRDLAVYGTYGHVDIPRLDAGGVDLAVFSVPTRHYLLSNYRRTPAVGDVMTLRAMASRWPRAAWLDPLPRARFMANRLDAAARASHGALLVIETREDLAALLERQARGEGVMGALLSLEGVHAAGREIASVDSLFAAGFRVFGITHLFDNDAGGSAHGWRKGGLTPFGRRVVARIDSLGGIIDLAHASRATIDDVLALTSRVVVSHTGLTSHCPGARNLDDERAVRIASRGGVLAIGFWKAAVCGDDVRDVARAIHHALTVAGDDHVALGSDFDGAVRAPFDAAHLAVLTDALLAEGLTRAQVRAVMGENAKRFLLSALPSRTR
jgi:microsomal dipeptidase-like Zn-dependent dipeptidase